MYQNVKRTCRVLFWLTNPIVLQRSRYRRCRRCVRSLLSDAWRGLRVIASNSDWLVVRLRAAVIGQNYCFGFGFYYTQSGAHHALGS